MKINKKLKKGDSGPSGDGEAGGAAETKPSLSYRASRIIHDKKDATKKRISTMRKK